MCDSTVKHESHTPFGSVWGWKEQHVANVVGAGGIRLTMWKGVAHNDMQRTLSLRSATVKAYCVHSINVYVCCFVVYLSLYTFSSAYRAYMQCGEIIGTFLRPVFCH